MCHSTESRPPAAPVTGSVKEAGPLTLTSADDTRFGAFQALPGEPNGRNVVILPDVRGVHAYYQDLARRFAEAGFGAVVVDYYGRTAGVGERNDDFDWQPLLPQVQADEVAADVRAAAEHVTAANPGATFSVGFCFGGGQSWRLAAGDLPLAGSIGFYGNPAHVEDVVEKVSSPVLMLIAGDDVATPQEKFHELDAKLKAAGATHEMYVYDNAPHSFFDRSFGEWREACDDAWRRILAFTSTHSATS
ncbi:dienelactone hydrolase family protein [Actinoplanes sp. NPDC049681]|uniref:dienelactone hydrolase family protein n=1 Tax=Actinoplanes sp. NPDC049681 TaxID=3363905 RepID=UPI0037A9A651